MTDVIKGNIMAEAYLFVRKGIPMGERDSRWADFTKFAVEEAKKQVEAEEFASLEKLERKLATTQGLSYDEWLAKAKKLYSIHPMTSVVTSIAHGTDHGKTWEEDSQVAARRRVYKLMQYKKYDHFTRGRDFFYDPDKASNE
jgi:hypothetical protein